MVDEKTPAPYVPAEAPAAPLLLRHSPFKIGFFGAFGALVAIFLSQQLLSISSILILLVMSMFLAIGLNPVVELFMRRGIRRGLSVLMVLVVVLGVLALFVVAIAPVISEQIAAITRNAPGWLDDLQANSQVQKLDDQYDVIAKARDYIQNGDFGQKVFGGALGVGLRVLSAVANSFIVLVLMIYFLASLPSIKHAAYSWRRPRSGRASASSATGSSARPAPTSPARSSSPCARGSARWCSRSSWDSATTPSPSPSWSGCSR